MELQVQKLSPDAMLPTKAYEGDAGFDLYAVADATIMPLIYPANLQKPLITAPTPPPGGIAINLSIGEVKTGIAVAIPGGYYGQIACRSGLGRKGLRVHPGVVDTGYRGEITVFVQNQGQIPITIKKGEKVAQMLLLPVPTITIVEVNDLPSSERGTKGFGSSDELISKKTEQAFYKEVLK